LGYFKGEMDSKNANHRNSWRSFFLWFIFEFLKINYLKIFDGSNLNPFWRIKRT